MVRPTIRERQVFEFLMDELLDQMQAKGNANFPTAHTRLEAALNVSKAKTGRMARAAAAAQAAIDDETSRTDYHE